MSSKLVHRKAVQKIRFIDSEGNNLYEIGKAQYLKSIQIMMNLDNDE